MLALRFAENVQIIYSSLFVVFIYWDSFEHKYLVITTASSIKLTNIIVLEILHTASPLEIANAKSPKLGFFIDEIIYVRFGQLSGCLYMHDGGGSFKDMQIYSRTFGVIIANSINIKIFEKIFSKWPII